MTGIDFNMFGSGSELANITKTLDVTSADATLGSSGTGKIQDLINQAGGAVAPDNCYASDNPVNCMARNIANNAVPMGVLAIFRSEESRVGKECVGTCRSGGTPVP